MQKIAVVIPCYRVRQHILQVLGKIGEEVSAIYVVDDCCPEKTGDFVREHCRDPRVRVINHPENQGVGGAVITGYRKAIADGMSVVVKIDGDGQMDPALLPLFVSPILNGEADYTKGNRFYDPDGVRTMPMVRLVGNVGLSFFTKFACGYWNIFDPTNGYTAIHTSLLNVLPLNKISRRYFFESDILFRLNITRAKVVDVPMIAIYASEQSNLRIYRVLPELLVNNIRNGCKRIFYNYFLRDFSMATLELVFGMSFLGFGSVFGAIEWIHYSRLHVFASTGTVMLAVLPIITGVQLLLSFVNYDIASIPKTAIHPMLSAQLWKRDEAGS